MKTSLSITILIVIALATSCDSSFGYASGDSQEGTVVDAEQDQPINDAFVIGQWSTSGIERTNPLSSGNDKVRCKRKVFPSGMEKEK